MQQIALITTFGQPPLAAPIDADIFMAKADKLHRTIVHLLRISPAEERLALLRLDEILSDAVVSAIGRTPDWK